MSENNENNETPQESADKVEEKVEEQTPETVAAPTVVMPVAESRTKLLVTKLRNSKITYVVAGAVGTIVALVAVAAVAGGKSDTDTPAVTEEPLALPVQTEVPDMSVFDTETN